MDGFDNGLRTGTEVIDRLLDEAVGLGEEARLNLQARARAQGTSELYAQHEFGVIATCLGYSVAWLLEQKAVAAGEIDAPSPTPVADHAGVGAIDELRLDPALADLGRRTRAFAMRIHRLAAN